MSGKCTKHQKSWETGRQWLSPHKSDPFISYLKACKDTFSTRQNGTEKLKQHEKTVKHTKAINSMRQQASFAPNLDGKLRISKATIDSFLCLDDKVVRAEILQALHIVGANQSFASTDSDSERFKLMFPDSEIAAKYAQHATKARYVIVYGLAPHVKESLIDDAKETFFCYKFDETTTSQVKKQYDGYITFFSKRYNQTVTSYCGSLFVGHCDHKELVGHFYQFLSSLQLSPAWLLNIGMDGPSVNLAFMKQLQLELATEAHSFINIGSCPLHIANNAFRTVLTVLKPSIDLDLIASDLHFFLSGQQLDERTTS